ncbi:MAG: tetratricopeptide repeat protein [Hydrogenophaga sp.]|jgi:tetratricopeptide (TPR) repeat protein|uniref:tetratricopeptide repeat protein n=1 Tax=Hydrogenophaga sp. TaxID=1904254 RepID=UPI00272725E8|nr:tetratricopeptide repeat protein [Hydrogenophaga sp.]MDO9479689.1 tetratricopeptide repeat protein [Hydrogenophaga sp.]MDP2093191.1 tetratricopeptide repeat protein [Hydrogenophaga sp.]MDP3344649.1 tetratricopeptide repeat protein [Hydrogenophaga sp.]MDP3806891.1 tetratricopeptide repeat protein [Hydrogenophaga sp.]MDP3923122.1 tetratricopeptide repeat protein [Hydrogenophaga sp.]
MNTLHRDFHPALGRANVAKRRRHRAARRIALLVALLLGGSMTAQAQTSPSTPPASEATSPVVNSALNAPLFYQLLLGELNVQAGEPGTGYSLILDAARKQRDALLYRRAVDVALQARSGEAALTAARAWAQDLPQSPEAHRFVLQILLALNRTGEASPVLRAILDRSSPAERNDTLNAIPQTFARVPDKAQALAVVREALAGVLKQRDHAAAAWTTLGRMELALDQLPASLASARQGHQSDPTSPFPALLALELLERGQPEAEALVRRHLLVSPQTPSGIPPVGLTYARILLDLQRYADARSQLDSITASQPALAEPWLLLATLQVQDNALPAATASLHNYMALARQAGDERSARGLTQAYLQMAQIAEKENDFAAANAWLDRIENADDIMAAQMRRASLLARQGQLAQARALLRNHPERRPEDARLKLVAEAQLLRDLKAWQQAYEVYTDATQRFPQDTELLYDQAMMAEKAGQPEAMERILRQLMAAKPDHQHAYNALGYSLAERNERLPEAKQLIEKALELAPTDAYIQDSLGWVEFRLGNFPRALEILQAAYGKRPDAEIAAHLGEVLWTLGRREEALKIWREGLLLSNDNETLQETLKRLRVAP